MKYVIGALAFMVIGWAAYVGWSVNPLFAILLVALFLWQVRSQGIDVSDSKKLLAWVTVLLFGASVIFLISTPGVLSASLAVGLMIPMLVITYRARPIKAP